MLPVAPIQYRKCDRLCERMLVALVCLFLAGIVSFTLLDMTRLMTVLALQQTSEFAAKFVLWPLLICWLGINGVLVFWAEVLQRRSPGERSENWGVALSVALLILGLSVLMAAFFLMAWALKALR
jgi:hypothetical protein